MKVTPLIQIFGLYFQIAYVLLLLIITSAILLTGISTRGLTILATCFVVSFLWLCLYHRKRIYIDLMFKDSL